MRSAGADRPGAARERGRDAAGTDPARRLGGGGGRLDRDAVLIALATLSDVQREAIELGYFGGLTQQEVAIRTGAPLGTVKSRMRLGLLALRRVLTGDEPEPGPDGTVET